MTFRLTFDEYQELAHKTALYTHDFYPAASLMVESAELADLFLKPQLRGDDKPININKVISEAGDVLWNLSELLHQNALSLQDVADYNIKKLASRADRGVIKGDGGDR
jgi:NTP pyrophosphatase (non-canonical NTP hydrolase)